MSLKFRMILIAVSGVNEIEMVVFFYCDQRHKILIVETNSLLFSQFSTSFSIVM